MGYVYAFRRGNEDEFKFGYTTDLDRRRKSLQTGSSKPLTLFDFIETDDYKEGERFVLRHLAQKRLIGEFCGVSAEEAREAMQACRFYLECQLPVWRAEEEKVKELDSIESSAEMLPSTGDVLEKYEQLLQLRAKKKLIEIELNRIGDQESRLETVIKLAIGNAKGIDGVATWETGDSRRKFDSDTLKTADPEVYEMYLTEFDQSRFRQERPDEYVSYQLTHRVRHFRLIE